MYYIDETTHPYFKNLARVIQYHLGEPSRIVTSTDDLMQLRGADPNAIYILNYVSFKNEFWKRIPWARYVAVQTEQMNVKGTVEYNLFLKNAVEVWDWTDKMWFGDSDIYRLEADQGKDIDVLFYGTLNARRLDTLKNLHRGYSLVTVVNEYGHDLWRYIHRSKIILSIHYYDQPENDMPRIAPLLSNRCFVIAEETVNADFNGLLTKSVVTVSKAKIPETVEYYLSKPLERMQWAERGYQWIKANPHRNK